MEYMEAASPHVACFSSPPYSPSFPFLLAMPSLLPNDAPLLQQLAEVATAGTLGTAMTHTPRMCPTAQHSSAQIRRAYALCTALHDCLAHYMPPCKEAPAPSMCYSSYRVDSKSLLLTLPRHCHTAAIAASIATHAPGAHVSPPPPPPPVSLCLHHQSSFILPPHSSCY